MRILQVVPTYLPAYRYGGPIRSVHGLASGLVCRGHEVHVFTTNMDGDEDLSVPVGAPVNIDGVQVTYFPTSFRRLAYSREFGSHVRRHISGFDVLHTHSVFLWPTSYAARRAKAAGVPYFLAPRGMLVPELIKRKSRLVKSAWISFVERRTISEAAGIHITSELEAAELNAMHLKYTSLHQIPNGVSIPGRATSAGASNHPFHDMPYAIFLGRLNWKKGLDRLIQAWRLVPNLGLVIAGPDEDEYRARLETMVGDACLGERVKFIGSVSDRDKWPLLQQAEMFVLASYSENFGNAVAEAMGAGCPVAITPEVGLATFVKENDAGVVCDGEPHAFATAINELMANGQLRKRLGANGRRAVQTQLSWDAVCTQAEKMYLSGVRKPAGGRHQHF